jgi:hypothetical protein
MIQTLELLHGTAITSVVDALHSSAAFCSNALELGRRATQL